MGIWLFCCFLELHDYRFIGATVKHDALPAFALLIAQSAAAEKDLLVDFLVALFKRAEGA